MPYRIPAPPEPPVEIERPLELLDRVHLLMDRFPQGFALVAALTEVAFSIGVGLLLYVLV
jgi:hypothetical protein